MREFIVTLYKNAIHQLGFTVDENDGIVRVARIIPLQPAEGQLRVGDHILSVNGVAFNNITPELAVQRIRTCGSIVTITVSRHVSHILLYRQSLKFGFALGGGHHRPLIVRRIQPGSPAAASSLKEGDQLELINGVLCSTLTLSQATVLIVTCGDWLILVVCG
jgi:C-terminal processing protease CtpA/Prc